MSAGHFPNPMDFFTSWISHHYPLATFKCVLPWFFLQTLWYLDKLSIILPCINPPLDSWMARATAASSRFGWTKPPGTYSSCNKPLQFQFGYPVQISKRRKTWYHFNCLFAALCSTSNLWYHHEDKFILVTKVAKKMPKIRRIFFPGCLFILFTWNLQTCRLEKIKTYEKNSQSWVFLTSKMEENTTFHPFPSFFWVVLLR